MSSSIWVFPGQGSQHKGMGKALFDRFPTRVDEADSVLGYSLRELCLDDPQGVLNETAFTQPALFAVSALGFLAKREAGLMLPDAYAGHSLGEFAALFAAGAFDFATGVALVKARGALMSAAPRGAMAAILGIDRLQVAELLASSSFSGIDIANVNCAQQTVISGLYDDIAGCESLFTGAGARFVKLNVSAAFHSRYMRDIEAQFSEAASGFTFHPLTARVISNYTSLPYPQTDYLPLLTRQISQPVRWYESLSRLLAQGDVEQSEIGPGQVLTQLFAKIKAQPMVLPAGTAAPGTQSTQPAGAAAPNAQSTQPAGAAAPNAQSTQPAGAEAPNAQSTQPATADANAVPGRPRLVFMYSGQGSQYYGMGLELYQQNSAFRSAMERCDALFRQHTGSSLLAPLYDEARRRNPLSDVMLSHAALFSLGFSLTSLLQAEGIEPDDVLGYSLGEYVAATVAGVLSLEDAMNMVVCQASLLKEHAQDGGMLSVLSPVTHFHQHPEIYQGSELASINFQKNFVVSGERASLLAVKQRLSQQGIVSLLLPVEHAFHSSGVDTIEQAFCAFAHTLTCHPARLPVYSAMQGTSVERWESNRFWRVVREPADFYGLVNGMPGRENTCFIDLGPAGTLSTFLKYGFADRLQHRAAINQFGRNVETVSALVNSVKSLSGWSEREQGA